MKPIDFSKLRRELDEAITFADFDAARQLAQRGLTAAQIQEDLGEINYFRAQQFIIDEHYKEAIEYLKLCLKYNSLDGAAYNDLALCAIEIGESAAAALNYFDKGIEVEPDYSSIYHNKGWYLNKLGRSQEAIPYLKKALELEPDRAVTYENLADAYFKLGASLEAVKIYRKALSLLGSSHEEIKEQIEAKIKMLMKK